MRSSSSPCAKLQRSPNLQCPFFHLRDAFAPFKSKALVLEDGQERALQGELLTSYTALFWHSLHFLGIPFSALRTPRRHQSLHLWCRWGKLHPSGVGLNLRPGPAERAACQLNLTSLLTTIRKWCSSQTHQNLRRVQMMKEILPVGSPQKKRTDSKLRIDLPRASGYQKAIESHLREISRTPKAFQLYKTCKIVLSA